VQCSILNLNKLVQFITIFHLLSHGYLVCDFETITEFFYILKVKNSPKNIGQMVVVKQCMILFLVPLKFFCKGLIFS
jgi:hypothetical protein